MAPVLTSLCSITGTIAAQNKPVIQICKGCGALLLEAIPHTEGLRLVASSAAIFDQHFHGTKVGA